VAANRFELYAVATFAPHAASPLHFCRASAAKTGIYALNRVIGPEYAAAFGMLAFEIEKYRRLNRGDLVACKFQRKKQRRRGRIAPAAPVCLSRWSRR
jgi:hypothetical protein